MPNYKPPPDGCEKELHHLALVGAVVLAVSFVLAKLLFM